jgi:hypothetical protein
MAKQFALIFSCLFLCTSLIGSGQSLQDRHDTPPPSPGTSYNSPAHDTPNTSTDQESVYDVCRRILASTADVNEASSGQTPLYTLVLRAIVEEGPEYDELVKTAKQLISKGANPYHKKANIMSILDAAAQDTDAKQKANSLRSTLIGHYDSLHSAKKTQKLSDLTARADANETRRRLAALETQEEQRRDEEAKRQRELEELQRRNAELEAAAQRRSEDLQREEAERKKQLVAARTPVETHLTKQMHESHLDTRSASGTLFSLPVIAGIATLGVLGCIVLLVMQRKAH